MKNSLTLPFSKILTSALFLVLSAKVTVKWTYFCSLCRTSLNNCQKTMDPSRERHWNTFNKYVLLYTRDYHKICLHQQKCWQNLAFFVNFSFAFMLEFSYGIMFVGYILISFSELSALTFLLSYSKVLRFLLTSAILKVYSILGVKV